MFTLIHKITSSLFRKFRKIGYYLNIPPFRNNAMDQLLIYEVNLYICYISLDMVPSLSQPLHPNKCSFFTNQRLY